MHPNPESAEAKAATRRELIEEPAALLDHNVELFEAYREGKIRQQVLHTNFVRNIGGRPGFNVSPGSNTLDTNKAGISLPARDHLKTEFDLRLAGF